MTRGDPTVRISCYWSDQTKSWDIVITGRDERGRWIAQERANTSSALDRGNGRDLLRRVAREIENLEGLW